MAVVRVVLALLYIWLSVVSCYRYGTAVVVSLLALVFFVLTLNRSKRVYRIFERTFVSNLNVKEMQREQSGWEHPKYAAELRAYDLHFSEFQLPENSAWAGRTLSELALGHKYSVHVASLLRGGYRINTPGGEQRLFPGDCLQVLANDEQLNNFGEAMRSDCFKLNEDNLLDREMQIRSFYIGENSPLLGSTIEKSGLRENYSCLVIGWMRHGHSHGATEINIPFIVGDILFIVGERGMLLRLSSDWKKQNKG